MCGEHDSIDHYLASGLANAIKHYMIFYICTYKMQNKALYIPTSVGKVFFKYRIEIS